MTTPKQPHTALPELHRIKGEFSLMNSATKELYPLTPSAIDELCRRSNEHAALLERSRQLSEALALVVNSGPLNNGLRDESTMKFARETLERTK